MDELWHGQHLTANDLKSLKPFGCVVEANVPKKRKRLGKIDTRSRTGCFVGYTDTNKMHEIWDFERKCFVTSRDLFFDETPFPEPSDFDEPPADVYTAYRPQNMHHPTSDIPTPTPALSRELTAEAQSLLSHPALDEIVVQPLFDHITVQPPPAFQVFKTYGEFEPDNHPPSFADAMRRPDANLWWEAFCDEIKAIIKRQTWTLATLPPGQKALPLRWICRVKRDATNTFERYKARIVVKGFA